jgi:hypothetical protein
MRNKRKGKVGKVGSSFDGILTEQGILEECEEQAIKQNPRRSDQSGHGEGPPHQGSNGDPYANQPSSARPFARSHQHECYITQSQRAAVAIGPQLRLELI